MENRPKDILKELSLQHVRLTQGPALVAIDPAAKVMYTASCAAPVRIGCVPLTARFEPTDFPTSPSYSFAPKRLCLAGSGDYLLVVGDTCVVAFFVREFLQSRGARAPESRPLIANVTVRDCLPHRGKALILTNEALLRVDPGSPEKTLPEELAYFGSDARCRPLRVCVREPPFACHVLFDNDTIETIP